VFLLLADNYNLLLPTIVSRCQIFQFRPVSLEEMKAFIEEKYDFPASDVDAAVRYSNGITGTALEFLQDKESLSIRNVYIDILERAIMGKAGEAQLLASKVVEAKEEGSRFLEFSQVWFRDLLLLKELQGSNNQIIININSMDVLAKHNCALTEGKLNSIMEIVKNTTKYVKYNVGIKNSVDGMLFNIAEVSLDNG
jgi:DNA polymerase-3 subunit delta'